MSKNLKIYYTTDTHGYLYPTNYKDSNPVGMGLFSVANAILPREENSLLLDCGDILQGSPFLQYLQKKELGYSSIADVVNEIGYDFVTLGNHDFNFGYETLKNYVNSINAKVICCNVVDKKNEMNILPYYIYEMENGIKVGIVGAVTSYVNVWESAENLEFLEVLPVFECVKKSYDVIKDSCDITVCMYHGGFEHDLTDLDNFESVYDSENCGLTLCKELQFDIILTGHQHMMVTGRKLFGTHTLQIPSNATYYGEIDVSLEKSKIEIESKNNPTPVSSQRGTLEEKYQSIQDDVQLWLDEAVGVISEPIEQINPIELMQNGWRFSDIVNSTVLEKTGVDICCSSLMNEPYPLSRTITIRDIVSSYPFSNEISIIEINGKDLRSALEHVASFFVLKDGTLSINPKYTEQKIELYNFDFYYGIEYCFDLRKEFGSRVVILKKDGKDIQDNDIFRMGLTGYRASGAGGYDMFKKYTPIDKTAQDVQQMLIEKITETDSFVLPKRAEYTTIV